MPIYEYVCEKCRQLTDVLQKLDEAPPERCSHCGAEGKMTRVVSRTSFVLRGGGWYSDLYSSKKPESSSAPKEGKEKAPSPASSSESSEKKTSEKADSSSKSDPSGTDSKKAS